MVAVKKDRINGDALGTGRRKCGCRARANPTGAGKVTVNRRDLKDYFPIWKDQREVLDTLEMVGRRSDVDVIITVRGGGTTGQAAACKMGIARTLVSYDMGHFPALRDSHALTRDSRMKERKKYGLHGMRRGTQFSKR